MNLLLGRQFTWNDESYFLYKKSHMLQFWLCFKGFLDVWQELRGINDTYSREITQSKLILGVHSERKKKVFPSFKSRPLWKRDFGVKCQALFSLKNKNIYHNNSRFWIRKTWVNSVDHRIWHLIRVYTVCHSSRTIIDTSTGSKIDFFSNFRPSMVRN